MTTQTSDIVLRLELPPVGISRAGHGMFWVGLCFCAGILTISAAMLILPHVGSTQGGVYTPPTGRPLPWPAWALMAAFAAVSVATTLAGINMGIRRAVLEVRNSALHIDQTDLRGRRHSHWQRDQITAIDARPTGLSVGGTRRHGGVGRSGAHGKRIIALYIDLTTGQSIRLLTGRNAKELNAIAQQLRNALGCGR